MIDYKDYWQPDGRIIRLPKEERKKVHKIKDYRQPDGSIIRM